MAIVFRVEGIKPFNDSKVCIGVYASRECAGVMLTRVAVWMVVTPYRGTI